MSIRLKNLLCTSPAATNAGSIGALAREPAGQPLRPAILRFHSWLGAIASICALAALAASADSADNRPDSANGPAANIPTAPGTTNVNTPQGTNALVLLDDTYRLAIGDRLSFRIVEDEDDPKALIVTDSGDVEAPYVGRIAALGKTCKQLAQDLKATLEKDYYYHATVIVAVDAMVKTHGKVYLVGAVRAPGPVEIPGDETFTVSKAILRSGGFMDFADERHVRITRKEGDVAHTNKTLIVNVGDVLRKGKTDLDVPLEPDDLIYVPDRLIRF